MEFKSYLVTFILSGPGFEFESEVIKCNSRSSLLKKEKNDERGCSAHPAIPAPSTTITSMHKGRDLLF